LLAAAKIRTKDREKEMLQAGDKPLPKITARNITSPKCGKCEQPTRLLAAEPHPRFRQTDLRTFQCKACGAIETVVAPRPHG
jgi:hypothetical protein